MSCRSTALSVFFLLFGVQSIDLTHALPLSSLPGFDLPEIDGSAVDICRIFPDATTAPPTTTTTTTTTTAPITTTTTAPITTRKQVVTTTKKPAIQSPPRKPEIKKAGTPIRPQPAPAGPITDGLSNPAARLLYYLLANSRGHTRLLSHGFTI
ncbi:lysine-rich arabinogalactan protein 19-like [Siniperca chuatsi]|uniref:lysine-rich arabinogalactan protein 19-like n=1 Tax=Siniperca chuatsi TaxID=119488 RepID=UPI001CE1F6CF|nr:lysine-rich arabinogalactan protein 19-like [Siniperca chuatsi]